jgi:transcriptional regulator with XRE-family HTH domain
MPFLQTLSIEIRRQRKAARLTQKLAAAGAGLSLRTVQRIERGDSGVAVGHYARYVAALGATLSLTRGTPSRPTLEQLNDFYDES